VPAIPPITFAIPFYSGISYLTRALESIVAQADPAWQAYVCDDGTEPGVEALATAIGRGRIGYIRNPKNLGMAANFNQCIDRATTDLVTVMHADDELMPSYAATMRAASQRHPDAAALFCRAEIIGPDGRPRFSLTDVVKDYIHPSPKHELVLCGEPGVRALLKGNFIIAPTLCFRKSVLGARRFSASYKFVLDKELTTGLLLDGDAIVGVPERCYRYRRHDDAATSQYTRTQLRFREESEYYDRMQVVARDRQWGACEKLAHQKRIIKMNIAYRTLKHCALLQLGEARRGWKLLREL
jgi:glycosyltransferase involved in cell wall biosynthesis